MTYTCVDCGFVFSRVSVVKACPSCEGNHVRIATEDEQDALQDHLRKQIPPIKEGSLSI